MALRIADVATAVKDSRGQLPRRDAQGSARTEWPASPIAWSEGDLVRAFGKLQSLLYRAEEIADGIARILAAAGIRVPDRPPVPPPKVRLRRFDDPRWELLARPGVGDVQIGKAKSGTVTVSIDGAPEFVLTTAAADLLAVLVAGEERDEDGFPPFRGYPELAAAYGVRTGRPESVRAVIVGLGRLREQLLAAGRLSPKLVETVPKRGARFRIRRKK